MRRYIILLLVLFTSAYVSNAEKYPSASYDCLEVTSYYVNGNEFQKDLLLYSKTFELSHPYYADKKHVRELRKETRKLYKVFAKTDDIKTFCCSDALVSAGAVLLGSVLIGALIIMGSLSPSKKIKLNEEDS